tara:strand:+ start:406 stop:597 length:192 start_codon:yes stop_codon:yes gene_type:complete
MSKGKLGYTQGDMSPKVEDYQEPSAVFSQEGFSKTTEYVSRKDAQQSRMASDIKKQAYKGRYS